MDKKIYIVDYLGVHCGMHYYLEAFKKVLGCLKGYSIHILSNYSDSDTKPFFVNQYKGNKIQKGIGLLRNLLKLKNFISHHKSDIFIYLTYGNEIDIPFLRLISQAPNHVVDIHEAIAQHLDAKTSLKENFKKLYSGDITTVISHSDRTDAFLSEYGYVGKVLHVPHFKYIFPKEYSLSNIPEEVLNAPDSKRINILFFGNLTENKGVDILIDAVNQLSEKDAERLNVIIAGKDYDGSVNRVKPGGNRHFHMFPRHISDDELRFLYQKADYLALPYRKTSQSGILEMAFYFKRPIVTTDVPYFRTTLEEFPSFGVHNGTGATEYSALLSHVIRNHGTKKYYLDSEYARYENREEIKAFVREFGTWLSDRQ